MFKGKTLLGVGCSHVYAPLGEDFDPVSCHERSWVKKLEKLAGFDNSVNLGQSGGSNQRSERMIMEYLSSNDCSNLVIAFGITDPSRFELPITDPNFSFRYTMKPFGSWAANKDYTKDPRELQFIETLYSNFHNLSFENDMVNKRLLHLSVFLDRLNIEHYFIELHNHGGGIAQEQYGITLPLIRFFDKNGQPTNAIRYMMEHGIPYDYTGHFDHDGHEFLAQKFYEQIKKIKIDKK